MSKNNKHVWVLLHDDGQDDPRPVHVFSHERAAHDEACSKCTVVKYKRVKS